MKDFIIPWKAASALGLLILSYVAASTVPDGPCDIESNGRCVWRSLTLVGVFHGLVMGAAFVGAVILIVWAVFEAADKDKK